MWAGGVLLLARVARGWLLLCWFDIFFEPPRWRCACRDAVLPAARLSRRERSSVVKVLEGPQKASKGPMAGVGMGGASRA